MDWHRTDKLGRKMVAVLRKQIMHGAVANEGWVIARKLAAYVKEPLRDLLLAASAAVRDDGVPYFETAFHQDERGRRCLWIAAVASRADELEEDFVLGQPTFEDDHDELIAPYIDELIECDEEADEEADAAAGGESTQVKAEPVEFAAAASGGDDWGSWKSVKPEQAQFEHASEQAQLEHVQAQLEHARQQGQRRTLEQEQADKIAVLQQHVQQQQLQLEHVQAWLEQQQQQQQQQLQLERQQQQLQQQRNAEFTREAAEMEQALKRRKMAEDAEFTRQAAEMEQALKRRKMAEDAQQIREGERTAAALYAQRAMESAPYASRWAFMAPTSPRPPMHGGWFVPSPPHYSS